MRLRLTISSFLFLPAVIRFPFAHHAVFATPMDGLDGGQISGRPSPCVVFVTNKRHFVYASKSCKLRLFEQIPKI
jgi:hypothetical protein